MVASWPTARRGAQAVSLGANTVRAADSGVEREIGVISNVLMARDLWAQPVLSPALAAVRRVHGRPRGTTEIGPNLGKILEAAGQWSRRLKKYRL